MQKKINLRYVGIMMLLMLSILIFFKPWYINYKNLYNINLLYVNGIRLIFCIVIFKYIIRNKLSRYIVWVCIFYLIKFVSNLFNNGNMGAFITEVYPVIAMCILIELYIKKDSKQLISAFTYSFNILLITNFISLLIKPIGYGTIYQKLYFLRGANQLMSFCVLTAVFTYINMYMKKDKSSKMLLILSIIISTYTVICIDSTTGLLTWGVVLLFMVSPKFLKNNKIFNYRNYIYMYSFGFLFIVIFKGQMYFQDFIENILNKSITLTGRTEIWEIALEYIKNKPLLGYGMANNTNIIFYQGEYLSTHNQVLQIIMEGGILAFIPFGIIICLVGKKLMKYKDDKRVAILAIGVLAVLINLFAEAMGMFDIFIVLTVAYNIESVIVDRLKVNKNLKMKNIQYGGKIII